MPLYPLHLAPLLLLGLLPLLAYVTWKSLTTGPGARRWAAFAVRALVLLLLVAALSDLRFADRADRLSVFFLVDHSASIPTAERDRSLERIRRTLEDRRPGDSAGLIVFGRNASIEAVPDPSPSFRRIASVISADYTDIAGALRLATASFPQGTQRRIVLVSDGNENVGNALEEARRAAASGVSIDAMPVSFRYDAEVQTERVVLPPRVRRGETFEIRVIVTATRETDAKIFLSLDRALLNEPRLVRLSRGKNVFVHSLALDRPGFYHFQARVEAEDDSLGGNNAGYGFTIVEGDPRVLLVGGTAEDVRYLAPALRSQGIPCDTALAPSAPHTPAGFQTYDCVVVANVPAADFTEEQMLALRSSVTNFGVGLLFVGGDHSYGAGGYHRTPVEEVLPVSCEVEQKKVLPNGALVLVLHTCEFADGNQWAKRISLRALERLTPRDWVGFLFYAGLGGACAWLNEDKLVRAENKEELRERIKGLDPGDMPDFDAGLQMAYGALREAKAAKKHIIVISDGDPTPPGGMLVRAMGRTKVAVTTVLINPHPGDVSAVNAMRSLARDTGGRFYQPRDGRGLPDIITRVARVVSTNFVKEEPFRPLRSSASDILKGFGPEGFPVLRGRVVTTAKGGSEVALRSGDDDPVLAQWRAGLGRTAAFTSDAKNRWGQDWVAWDGYGKFWSQAVRWCMRTVSRNNFHLQARIEGGRGRVTLDALDDRGRFVNFLGVRAKVVSPSFEELPLAVRQEGPGRYEGSFPADEVGAYYVSLVYEGEDVPPGFMATGASLSYSPEYRERSADLARLRALTDASGGRILGEGDDVFVHDLPRMLGMEPRWPLFLAVALFLFLADVTVRRVVLPWARLRRALARTAGRLGRMRPAAPEPASSEAMSALLRRKEEVAGDREEASEFRERLAGAPPPGDPVDVFSEGPGEPAAPPPPPPGPPSGDEDASGFMQRLLDAKKKAFEKRQKGEQP